MTAAPGLSTYDVMTDPALLGPHFAGPSWDAWKCVARAADGLPLSRQQKRRFAQIAGKRRAPTQRVKEIIAKIGRRGGKDRFLTSDCITSAIRDHREYLSPGERATCLMLAVDRAQARVSLERIRGAFEYLPLLKSLVRHETKDGLLLTNGNEIIIAPNNYKASARGRTIAWVGLNECSFYQDGEGANPDIELLRSIVPATLTIPYSRICIVSSPFRKSGLLHQKITEHFGVDSDTVLAISGTSRDFNPTLDQAEIDRALLDDPIGARCEYLGEWRDDIGSYISRDVLMRAVIVGVLVQPPVQGATYKAFYDGSGGVHDSAVLAIGHREPDGPVVDLIKEWPAPHTPAAVISEAVGLCRQYRVREMTGDRYGAQWVKSTFSALGLQYNPARLDRSAVYSEALPSLISGRVRMVENERAIRQFCALERTPRAGGRDLIDHPKSRLASDDVANAVAGCVWLLERPSADAAMSVPLADLSIHAPAPGPEPWRSYNEFGQRLDGSGRFEPGRFGSDWSPRW
jgi:hypothetical protein